MTLLNWFFGNGRLFFTTVWITDWEEFLDLLVGMYAASQQQCDVHLSNARAQSDRGQIDTSSEWESRAWRALLRIHQLTYLLSWSKVETKNIFE